jgi:hypothetical protein
MEKDEYHLKHNIHGGWDLAHAHTGHVVLHRGTRAEAERVAGIVCAHERKNLVVFSKDGRREYRAGFDGLAAHTYLQL